MCAIVALPAGAGQPAAQPLRILVLGDSLSAGFGLRAEDSFPAQLERALGERGVAAEVINAGVSGDTTTGGRARLEWSLAEAPDVVILELGANDGLRGIDPEITRANLAAMLQELKRRDIAVLLTGMLAPPNMGTAYTGRFNRVFPELAAEFGVALYPFFLQGVAARPALNQVDGIHPNAEGVAVIVRNILPYVLDITDALR